MFYFVPFVFIFIKSNSNRIESIGSYQSDRMTTVQMFCQDGKMPRVANGKAPLRTLAIDVTTKKKRKKNDKQKLDRIEFRREKREREKELYKPRRYI